jgi:hypothetical protein
MPIFTALNGLLVKDDTMKAATARQDVSIDGREGCVYAWNTGTMSVIFPPEGWSFDPTRSKHIAAPYKSTADIDG